jgi:hypothetical protein
LCPCGTFIGYFSGSGVAAHMRLSLLRISTLVLSFLLAESAIAQTPPAQSQPQDKQGPAPAAGQLAQTPGAQLITLDQAIQMALEHNHTLLAARTTIEQNLAEEITANLRPDPVLMGDTQFLPGQYGAVRRGLELPFRARYETAAPPAGGERPDCRDAVAGGRQ